MMMMIHPILILSISLPIIITAETTINPNIDIDLKTYVNCGHAERLLQVDSLQHGISKALKTCWNHGVTLDELTLYGITTMDDLREDMENYSYDVLYIPCEDIFSANITRLTTRLLEDYVNCCEVDAINEDLKAEIDERFSDILQVYNDGNSSFSVDESTLVSCNNASKWITLQCREYGLPGDQWNRGLLTYYYTDKWVIEEEVVELSLGCDRIFNAKLHEDIYDDYLDAFVKCQMTLGVDDEIRDGIEKKYAKELMAYRGGVSKDLRNYVSCRHLMPINVRNGAFSASWYAYDQCRVKGLTYEQICNETTTTKSSDEFEILMSDVIEDVKDMYIECENVFNEELWSFTTGLIRDYQTCNEVGKIDFQDRIMLEKKFAKLFELLETKHPKKILNTITENLISCSGFTGALADECRHHGSTIAQELRGIGSLALILGDKWLNTESLDKLYIRCEDIFDKYITYLDDISLEKFLHCRWMDGISDDGLAYIDMRISDDYKDNWKYNDSRFVGDSDVQISQTILFDEEAMPLGVSLY